MLLIDTYANNSRLKNTNTSIKLIITMLGITISMISSNIYVLLLISLFMSLLILFILNINIKSYIELLKIPIIFLVMGATAVLINISYNSENLIYSMNIFQYYIGISNQSIINTYYVVARSISCLTCVYFFMLTTPFNKILLLLKKLHISDTLIEIMMLMYRFIFIFLEEMSDIRKSQELRFGYINIRHSYKSIGLLMRMLFSRLMIRYEDMYIALDMKLYDGKFQIVEDENV